MVKHDDDLLSIGSFAQRTRLSARALRIYDDLGLLRPVVVDPDSGYRYYRPEQTERARLIGLLRRLEMPLEKIAELIDVEGAVAAKSLASYWQNVEAGHRERRKLVRYLEMYLSQKGDKMFEVQARSMPAAQVISIQRRVLVDALPTFIEEAMTSLFDQVRVGQATVDGAPLVIYHGEVNKDSDGPVEVCVPFSGTVEPTGEAHIRNEPAHDELFTRITKAQVEFPMILDAYEAVHRRMAEAGRTPAGSPREVYFADWDAVGPSDPACDIAWPVESFKAG
jgi:DNA-binding transcriptional MerR regulator